MVLTPSVGAATPGGVHSRRGTVTQIADPGTIHVAPQCIGVAFEEVSYDVPTRQSSTAGRCLGGRVPGATGGWPWCKGRAGASRTVLSAASGVIRPGELYVTQSRRHSAWKTGAIARPCVPSNHRC